MIRQRRALLFVVSMLFCASAFALSPPLSPQISPTRFISDTLQTFTLSGYNMFEAPVRVFFTGSDGIAHEAYFLHVSDSQVFGATPQIDTGGGERELTVTIINRAGMPGESRLELPNRVTFFELDRTLQVGGVSPAAIPLSGMARMTLFGSGFSAPVQIVAVYADASEQEVQVLQVSFNDVVFVSPPARGLGPVALRVTNISSGASVNLANAFRYYVPMSLHSVTPLRGPAAGNTVITIDGSDFNVPLSITVAGIAAKPIEVSGTRIVAVTGPAAPAHCDDISGPVIVTSVANGDIAIGPTFTYLTPRARFVAIPELVAGLPADVTIGTLTNPVRFEFHNRVVTPLSARDNGNGTTTYTLPVPTDLLFRTRRCRRGDSVVALPLTTSLTVTDRVTGCSATEVVVVQPEPAMTVCQSELPGVEP